MPHSVWPILLLDRMISLICKRKYESMGICFVFPMFTRVPWYRGEATENFFVICRLHKSYCRPLPVAFFVKHVGETAELTSSIEQLKSHIGHSPLLFTSLITIADPFWKLFSSLLPHFLDCRFLKSPRLCRTHRHLFHASSYPIHTSVMLTPSVIACLALAIIEPPHPHSNYDYHHDTTDKCEYTILVTDLLPYSLLTLYHYFCICLFNLLSNNLFPRNSTQPLFFSQTFSQIR
jgi:hypothetical protein